LDPMVTPARILLRQAHHTNERVSSLTGGWTALLGYVHRFVDCPRCHPMSVAGVTIREARNRIGSRRDNPANPGQARPGSGT
jgi:hypothetical protein